MSPVWPGRPDHRREAAYADLVAALIDLRSRRTTAEFDKVLAEAVAQGEITDELARRLRALQRDAERALVDHAAAVLPAALVAIDLSDPPSPPSPDPPTSQTESRHLAAGEPTPVEPADVDPADIAPPTDLTARRLLVAGLRPIRDASSGRFP